MVARFLLEKLRGNDFFAAAVSPNARKDRGQRCEAWFYVGMKRLLAGDKDAAAVCFRKSLATEAWDWTEYHFAQAELKALGN
jgi:lipoprotein NlpI